MSICSQQIYSRYVQLKKIIPQEKEKLETKLELSAIGPRPTEPEPCLGLSPVASPSPVAVTLRRAPRNRAGWPAVQKWQKRAVYSSSLRRVCMCLCTYPYVFQSGRGTGCLVIALLRGVKPTRTFQQQKYNPSAKPFLPSASSSMTHTRLPDTATSTPIQAPPRHYKHFSPYLNGKVRYVVHRNKLLRSELQHQTSVLVDDLNIFNGRIS